MAVVSTAVASAAAAEDQIGSAVSIVRDVSQSYGGHIAPLKIGEHVINNQIISTAPASQAKLEFLDRTELQIAPVSSIRLDSFVYNGVADAKQVVVNTTVGAFRFVSGYAHNYTVKTPTATLGIRGTTFALRVSVQRTDVVLYNGEVSVCSRSGGECAILLNPCTFVIATPGRVTSPRTVDSKAWSFDGSCSPGIVHDHATNKVPAPTSAALPAALATASRAPSQHDRDGRDHGDDRHQINNRQASGSDGTRSKR